MPADPSVILSGIRDRAGVVAKLGPPHPGGDLINAAHRSAADVPRLLAAAEAVLKAADDWDAESDRLDDLADKPGTDEDARPVLSGEAQGYSDCAADLRQAITRALNGENSG